MRLQFEYVKNYFKEQGCVLLSKEYKNSKTNLDYICNCGRTSKIQFSNFRIGARCKNCWIERRGNSYEYIKNYFEEQGCTLLSKEYKNIFTILDYICNCGSPAKIRFNSFQHKNNRCRKCGYKKTRNSYEYIKNYFEEQGCTLLSKEYKNNEQKLYFICSCGRKGVKKFTHFIVNPKCKKCSIATRKGGFSKISQKLFWEIYNLLSIELQEDSMFAEHHFEYPVEDKKYDAIRKYDFTIPSIKKCIEYNGVVFHATPDLLSTMKGWQPFIPEMTAQESWDFDKHKNSLIEAEGFDLLVIWENEENQLEKCIEFINER